MATRFLRSPANEVVDYMVEHHQWIVGTPDDCIAGIARLQEASGGFGGLLLRAEDWAPRDRLHRSYELLARYVMPQFQGSLTGIVASNQRSASMKEFTASQPAGGLATGHRCVFGRALGRLCRTCWWSVR